MASFGLAAPWPPVRAEHPDRPAPGTILLTLVDEQIPAVVDDGARGASNPERVPADLVGETVPCPAQLDRVELRV